MRNLRLVCLCLLVVAGCVENVKPPPTDDPDVDDAKADSLRAPTMMNPIVPGDLASGTVTTSSKYLGYPITLSDGQQVAFWAGGADDAGGTLDTVAYLYGPKNAAGRRGSYLVRNDDWSSDSYASRFDATATAGDGEYLFVVTTYTKPDPGKVIVSTDLRSGRPALPPPATPHAMPLDGRTFVDPELVAATSVDDILAILDRDAGDGDDLTIASDIAALWGGRKWPLDVVDRVDQAVHAALPGATTFGQWSPRAQSIALSTDRVFVPVTTTRKPNIDAVVASLLGSMPGFELKEAIPTALGYNGKLYGFEVDVRMANGNGDLFTSHEYFDRAGTFLGDAGGDFDSGD